jgi:hypothetical protein
MIITEFHLANANVTCTSIQNKGLQRYSLMEGAR